MILNNPRRRRGRWGVLIALVMLVVAIPATTSSRPASAHLPPDGPSWGTCQQIGQRLLDDPSTFVLVLSGKTEIELAVSTFSPVPGFAAYDVSRCAHMAATYGVAEQAAYDISVGWLIGFMRQGEGCRRAAAWYGLGTDMLCIAGMNMHNHEADRTSLPNDDSLCGELVNVGARVATYYGVVDLFGSPEPAAYAFRVTDGRSKLKDMGAANCGGLKAGVPG